MAVLMAAKCDGKGWVYWNEDCGEEYAPNHPVHSGEVPEAKHIRRSTAQEDTLWVAFQGEFNRAHSLEMACSSAPISCEPMHPDEEGWSEWIHPLPGYLMQCCGCDLIHEMQVRIATDNNDGLPLNEGEQRGGPVVVFRMKRALDAAT